MWRWKVEVDVLDVLILSPYSLCGRKATSEEEEVGYWVIYTVVV